MKEGAFTFVLHSHLPYCRRAGRWPHGEEWLHEGISETYLPLLNALYDLRDEGCPFKSTLGITPVLAEQLADPLILEHFRLFMEDKIERALADIKRFEIEHNGHLAYLAKFYLDYYQGLVRSFEDRFQGNLIAALRRLQDEGYLEILTSAATHGYLPLLERDSSVYGQLQVGVETYKRHFGRLPRAIWLPECGYRPAFYASKNRGTYLKPGIEQYLADLGIGLFFSETHTIEGGEPVGKATGAVIGPYGNIPKRYVVPIPDYKEPTMKATYLPYWVQSAEVAVLGRNNRTGMQVWSADWGYPGDFDYREFHKKDGTSGLQYWRVTGARLDLAYKDYYHPDWASIKAREHARHYAWLVEELLCDFRNQNSKFGIIAAAYDTELFGHWWFEGIQWIKEVLRRLAVSQTVELTTASEFIEKHPPEDVLALNEGSWGQAGNHFTWLNPDTEWMWPIIHTAELRMEELVARHPNASGNLAQILNQAARELLLLESSDWPFLVTTGQAREYASTRFQEHMSRFDRLADIASSGEVDEAAHNLCHEMYELDNVFPDIDYRFLANREQKG
jgi:1,4-alpha-glucan branching enzyme